MATVNVSGISSSTTETQLRDFFSFCGKIKSVEHKGSSAVVHFEKKSAARTALMLNEGTLDGATLTVTSDSVDEHDDPATSKDGDHFDQSDKPKAGIAAEYLAKGYVLSDKVLQKAIEMDHKQGISERFLNYIRHLDTTLGARLLGPEKTVSGKVQEAAEAATQQARSVDEQKGISKTANDYYTKALSSPFGEKVRAFYTTTSKQVQDIHEEARRLAESQKAQETGTTTEKPAGENVGSGGVPEPKTQVAPTVV